MYKRSIITGVLVGAVSTIYSFSLEKTLLDNPNVLLGLIPMAFLIGGMIYVDIIEKKENGGFLTSKEGFVPAAIVGILSTLISSLFSYINITFIKTKDELEAMVKMIADGMVQKGLSQSQATEIAAKTFNSTNILLMGLGGGIIMALIVAAIIAASLSKKKPLV